MAVRHRNTKNASGRGIVENGKVTAPTSLLEKEVVSASYIAPVLLDFYTVRTLLLAAWICLIVSQALSLVIGGCCSLVAEYSIPSASANEITHSEMCWHTSSYC